MQTNKGKCSDIDLQGIFQAFNYKRFLPGQVLFNEGSAGEGIFIILTGKFLLELVEKKSTRYPVVTGLRNFFATAKQSNSDCIAIGHSCLLFMHKKHFEKLETNYNWLRKAMMKLSSQRTGKLLRQVPFFNDLSSHYLNRLGCVCVLQLQ